jgi:hypothetical protein
LISFLVQQDQKFRSDEVLYFQNQSKT